MFSYSIIVWKLDRFARNRYDSAHYKAQLRKYGVKVISATENISDGPEGIILESMLEGMAEYYSAELSEKVIRGHTENALKCMYNGGTPTFGYCNNLAPGETERTCRKVGAHKKEAQERVAATPAQKEYAKVYNRLKARKQRGKISVDDWNAAVAKAQDLKDLTERGDLSDEELRRQLAVL